MRRITGVLQPREDLAAIPGQADISLLMQALRDKWQARECKKAIYAGNAGEREMRQDVSPL
jgi:hypothetical protein